MGLPFYAHSEDVLKNMVLSGMMYYTYLMIINWNGDYF